MLIELKWNKQATTALTQTKEKQYSKALKEYQGNILLIGICYDKEIKHHTCLIERG